MNTRPFLKPGEKPPVMPIWVADGRPPDRRPGRKPKPPPLVVGKD